jgi:hypothetical protein
MVAKHRRNFLPTFLINLLLWASWIYVVLRISPGNEVQLTVYSLQLSLPMGMLLFFSTLTLALALSLAFAFSNTRRGFFLSLFLSGLLLLRLLKQSQLLNVILLAGILICLEVYFKKAKTTTYGRG